MEQLVRPRTLLVQPEDCLRSLPRPRVLPQASQLQQKENHQQSLGTRWLTRRSPLKARSRPLLETLGRPQTPQEGSWKIAFDRFSERRGHEALKSLAKLTNEGAE